MRFHQHGPHQPLGRGPGRADAADPFPPANLPGEPLAVVREADPEADVRCDRVAILRDGRIRVEDALVRLKTRRHPAVMEVVLARPNDAEGLAARVRAFQPEIDVTRRALRMVTPHTGDVGRDALEATSSAGCAMATLRATPPPLDAVFRAHSRRTRSGAESRRLEESPDVGHPASRATTLHPVQSLGMLTGRALKVALRERWSGIPNMATSVCLGLVSNAGRSGLDGLRAVGGTA